MKGVGSVPLNDVMSKLIITLVQLTWIIYTEMASPLLTDYKSSGNKPNPIILLPGDGGCQAYGELKNENNNQVLVWLSLQMFIYPETYGAYFQLKYNKTTHKTTDNDMMKITFPGWGETWSVENLDNNPHFFSEYFGPIVRDLRQDPFFVSNISIRGAPYDFRKGLNENEEVLVRLKLLFEDTYKKNGDRAVVLLGHSLGCLYSQGFLRYVSAEWKRKYVKSLVLVSCPFGGSVKALKMMASGDNLGFFLKNPIEFRSFQRSMPSLAFLFPDSRIWSPNENLIVTPETSYSAHDYKRFFHDINYTIGYSMLVDTKSSIDSLERPTEIEEIYCVHGLNITTIESMIYSPSGMFYDGFPDQNPQLVTGNGDGTVNLRSLEICKFWPKVNYTILPGVEHVSILYDMRLLKIIREIVGATIE